MLEISKQCLCKSKTDPLPVDRIRGGRCGPSCKTLVQLVRAPPQFHQRTVSPHPATREKRTRTRTRAHTHTHLLVHTFHTFHTFAHEEMRWAAGNAIFDLRKNLAASNCILLCGQCDPVESIRGLPKNSAFWGRNGTNGAHP